MAYVSNFLLQIAPKKSKYSNMAYSSNLLLLTHQNGDLLILKNWKLLKYGLFVKFLLQILPSPIYFCLLIKMVTYSSGKIKKYSNTAFLSHFCSEFYLLLTVMTYSPWKCFQSKG